MSARSRVVLRLGVVAWAGLVLAAIGWMMHYESQPGPPQRAPVRWPPDTSIPLGKSGATLVAFIRPGCFCSTATLQQLSELMTEAKGRLRASVMMVASAERHGKWRESAAATRAAQIPGVEVRLDEQGREAHRFGSLTSGFVAVYTPRGELMFSGGITPARGQWGPNRGVQAILSSVQGHTPKISRTSIFGCDLEKRQWEEAAR